MGLEKADGLQRAMLLLLAQWYRVGMTEQGGAPHSIFDRPLDHSRTDLVELYSGLENIRNNATRQREHIQKSLERFGGWPAFAVEHSKNTNRGLEVLMCSVASGIAPDVRDDVRPIWMPYTPEAMRRLQEIAQLGRRRAPMRQACSGNYLFPSGSLLPTLCRARYSKRCPTLGRPKSRRALPRPRQPPGAPAKEPAKRAQFHCAVADVAASKMFNPASTG